MTKTIHNFEIGQTFGKLTIISKSRVVREVYSTGNKHSRRLIKVRCECGTKKEIRVNDLLYGRSSPKRSCGSQKCKLRKEHSVKLGNVYGKLTVIKIIDNQKVEVKCQCGKEKIVYKGNLQQGKTKSCHQGCGERIGRATDRKDEFNKQENFQEHPATSVLYNRINRNYDFSVHCNKHNLDFNFSGTSVPQRKSPLRLDKKCPECSKEILGAKLRKGMKEGNLTLLDVFYKDNNQFGKFLCGCGTIKDIRPNSVFKRKITKSCGKCGYSKARNQALRELAFENPDFQEKLLTRTNEILRQKSNN